MFRFTALCIGLLLSANALALPLADLLQDDTSNGLKDALTQGAQIAIHQLGQPDGFNNDPNARTELPGKLGKVAKLVKQFGMGAQADQFEASMDRVAEATVLQTQGLPVRAVKEMTMADTEGVLKGGDDAITEYLDESGREQLHAKFLPIVKQTTGEVGLVKQYNVFASQAATLGVVDAKSANVEGYVTGQALDGLSKMIAKQEKNIHRNPAAAATGLIKEVSGAVK